MNIQPDVLAEIGQLSMAELDALSIARIDVYMQQLGAIKECVRHYENAMHSALNNRFSERAQLLRNAAGKSTGIVRIEEEGYVVIADLPKRAEYDQLKLKEAVESLRKWGENPEDYVGIEVKVSETKYNAWPPGIRQLFEPARTLKTGKPAYRLEAVQPSHGSGAANDHQFNEVA